MKNGKILRKRKTGLPPGTLLDKKTGESAPSVLTLYSYSDSDFREETVDGNIDFGSLRREDGVIWLDIVGIEDSGLLEKIGEAFDIHPLVLEDIQHTDQRPKIADYGNYIYITAKMLWWNEKQETLKPEQVSLLLLENMVISFQEKEGDTFGVIRDRLREHKGRIRSSGADYLTYALLDSIVDYYFQITEVIEEKFDSTEGSILLGKDEQMSETLYLYSTELTELRHCFQPLREVIFQMQKQEIPFIQKRTKLFLSDIGDHIFMIADTHDSLREKLSNLQNMYTANLSNKMNSVMKVLTIIATIFIPLTFIVGVYGMNFEHMPELSIPWAYPLVLGVMAVIVTVMLILFKRKRWL